jgi:hypothetical protein
MRTNGHDADSKRDTVAGRSTPDTVVSFRPDGQTKIDFDYLGALERHLSSLWSEYIEHQDKYGYTEKTKALRERYFSLYRRYQREKRWKKIVSNN